MPRWPPLDHATLIAAYAAGASITAVAQQLGLSANTVYTQLRRAQIPLRSAARPVHAHLTSVDSAALCVAYRAGETMTTLATRFGRSTSLVSQVLRQAGVTRRPRGPRRRHARNADSRVWPG